MVASGKVNVKPLITHRCFLKGDSKSSSVNLQFRSHRFKLEETLKAFEAAKSGKDGAIKIMIKC